MFPTEIPAEIPAPPASDPTQESGRARSFGRVAEAYDRGRPGYPVEAVRWLTGPTPARVVELGAGTGKLTRSLLEQGHEVLATDPDPDMVRRLRERLGVAAAVACAEQIPAATRDADVVVCAQSFHWFDHPTALPEIARVLRPGGSLAVAWNIRDEAVPWVRKLTRMIGTHVPDHMIGALLGTECFEAPAAERFRFWQTHDRDSLLDMVRSRSSVFSLPAGDRERLLEQVGRLYDDYGRGADGMRLPYQTWCYRAVVGPPEQGSGPERGRDPDHEDPGMQLIDFR